MENDPQSESNELEQFENCSTAFGSLRHKEAR